MVSIGWVGSKKKNGRNCGNSARARLDTPSVRAAPRMATRSPVSAAGVTAGVIALAQLLRPLPGRPVAAAARRAHQHPVAALEHVLAPVIHLLAVDPHVAEAARAAAGEPGRREARALGHEAHHDGARRLALDQDVLTEPAAE